MLSFTCLVVVVHGLGHACMDYERGGLYVPCLHLRLLWAGRFIASVHACWTTSEAVRRVGPRANKFVEAYNIPMIMVEYVLISYRSGWWFKYFTCLEMTTLGKDMLDIVMSWSVRDWWCNVWLIWAGRFILMIFSCENTSGEVHMFRAHTWKLLRTRRFVTGWITRVELWARRFVDDRVTFHTGAYDNPGANGEA